MFLDDAKSKIELSDPYIFLSNFIDCLCKTFKIKGSNLRNILFINIFINLTTKKLHWLDATIVGQLVGKLGDRDFDVRSWAAKELAVIAEKSPNSITFQLAENLTDKLVVEDYYLKKISYIDKS